MPREPEIRSIFSLPFVQQQANQKDQFDVD